MSSTNVGRHRVLHPIMMSNRKTRMDRCRGERRSWTIVAQKSSSKWLLYNAHRTVCTSGQSQKRAMLLDCGATKKIVRPDIIGRKKILLTEDPLTHGYRKCAAVHVEAAVDIGIGCNCCSHQVLVDIAEEVMWMDVMFKVGFVLDLKNGILRVEDEEIPVHQPGTKRFVVLAEDVTLTVRNETRFELEWMETSERST